MIGAADNLALAADSIRAHKLRAPLTVLGLTMGVATLITVMTLVQGANLYVEQKIADLGTNVFRVSRGLPFAVTDFTVLSKAQRNKNLYTDDLAAVAQGCPPLPGGGRRAEQRHRPPLQRSRTRGRHHVRPHAQHGGDRYPHGGARPLFHRTGRPARCRCVPDRRPRGAGVLSGRRPDGEGDPGGGARNSR